MGFSRQGDWSELHFPTPGYLPDPGVEHVSLTSPSLTGDFLTTSATWEAKTWLRSSPTSKYVVLETVKNYCKSKETKTLLKASHTF